MLYRRPWRPVPFALLAMSIALHLITVVLYFRLPARFAAYTVFPIWVWGVVGILLSATAFLCFRAKLSLIITLIWTLTVLLFADEARAIGRLGQEAPKPGNPEPFKNSPVIRVATLNCARIADPVEATMTYQPDIIFLQEIPHAYRLKILIDQLFGGQGDYRYDPSKGCAIVVRGRIESTYKVPKYRSQILTAKLLNGRRIQLVNVHLHNAATNLRFWQRSCWREHNENRRLREIEFAYLLGLLKQKTPYPRFPALIAGDFNAPANDVVYRQLGQNFTNAFDEAGTGWGNTFHRTFPLLRIDHVFSTSHFVPVRAKVVDVQKTDHRMIVADFILR